MIPEWNKSLDRMFFELRLATCIRQESYSAYKVLRTGVHFRGKLTSYMRTVPKDIEYMVASASTKKKGGIFKDLPYQYLSAMAGRGRELFLDNDDELHFYRKGKLIGLQLPDGRFESIKELNSIIKVSHEERDRKTDRALANQA